MIAFGQAAALAAVVGSAVVPAAVRDFADAWARMSSYRAVLTVHETSGASVEDRTYDYSFAKPHTATISITSGPGRGGHERWDGADTVVASPAGVLSLLKLRLSIKDPRVVTLRGDTIDMASFGWFLQHLRTQGTLSASVGPSVAGVPTTELTLDIADPVANGGITRDVVDLSSVTKLPVRASRYVGTELVKEIEFSNVVTGT